MLDSNNHGIHLGMEYAEVTEHNNVITSNRLTSNDVGIYIWYSNHNIVRENNVSANVTGITLGYSDNCLIANNITESNDCGIGVQGCSPTILNNTVAYNSNCGIYCSDSPSPSIVNNIIWGNDDDLDGCTATYSDIEDGDPGEGNISEDPMFVDSANGDYHLQPGSPCIDTGTSEGAPDSDFEGDSRPQEDGYDIGADEYVATALHMECFEINYISAADKHGTKWDKIKIEASLKLSEKAEPFDPDTDVVTVTIDDQVITIPEGSFEEKSTYYRFKGDVSDVGRVHMHLNFEKCRWWISVYGKDASDLVQGQGATVKLSIGNNVGEDSLDWTWQWENRWTAFAMFIERPPIRCCRLYDLGH